MATVPTLPFAQSALSNRRLTLVGVLALVVLMALVAMRLFAQVEGDRGIIPVAATTDIEVDGIAVNTTGRNAQAARLAGWDEAAVKAWAKAGGPAMAPADIQAMVSAVVIEREQIGPHRYIAQLSVVFDRASAGQYIGGGNVVAGRARSAPLLVIPVVYSGGVSQVFEVRTPWQRAWANFRAGNSPIDYVRPTGSGADSLVITAGQPSRRSRVWWRNLLDQFGAADVIMPEARLERQWPGGPVRGTFTARYGPDNRFLESFTMTANDEASLPRMLASAVERIDQIYARALDDGTLRPDSTLNIHPQIDPALAALIAQGQLPDAVPTDAAAAPIAAPEPVKPVVVNMFIVQFASPDAGAVDAALGAVRATPGVQGASTTSLAMGGTSVMRVSFAGELSALAASLRSRGWTVAVGNNALSIRR